MQKQRVYPLILVHGSGTLEPEFKRMAEEGCLVAKVPSCSAASVFAHAGRAARDLGFEFVVCAPPDLIWRRRASWPLELTRAEGVLVAPSDDVSDIAEAWDRDGLSSLRPLRRLIVATNQSPGSRTRRPLIRYSYDHPCWSPSMAVDRADSMIAWEPGEVRADTIQGQIHTEVLRARGFWTRKRVTA